MRNCFRTFTVGREVWLKDGARWLRGKVYTVRPAVIDVVLDDGHRVGVHPPVAFQCLRVSRPKA